MKVLEVTEAQVLSARWLVEHADERHEFVPTDIRKLAGVRLEHDIVSTDDERPDDWIDQLLSSEYKKRIDQQLPSSEFRKMKMAMIEPVSRNVLDDAAARQQRFKQDETKIREAQLELLVAQENLAPIEWCWKLAKILGLVVAPVSLVAGGALTVFISSMVWLPIMVVVLALGGCGLLGYQALESIRISGGVYDENRVTAKQISAKRIALRRAQAKLAALESDTYFDWKDR